MRARVNRLLAVHAGRAGIAALLSFAQIPSIAEADSAGTGWADARWVPSFAITAGAFTGEQRAAVSSDCRAPGSDPPAAASCDPAEPGFGSELRPGDENNDDAATPYVGGSLQLATPALAVIGRPRLFAGVEIPYQFGIDRNVAQKQRPTGLEEPEEENVGETLQENALLGAGSRTRSEVQGLTFGANAGVSLAFEARGRRFRIKPSANWIRYEVDVLGRVESGICNNAGGSATQDTCDLDGIKPLGLANAYTRVITLKGGESQWFEGIGPGLELEIDIRRAGPIGASLFLSGGGYYIYSDRTLAFSVTRTIGPDPVGAPVDYHADFSFRVDPWLFRAGLGIRFAWLGDLE